LRREAAAAGDYSHAKYRSLVILTGYSDCSQSPLKLKTCAGVEPEEEGGGATEVAEEDEVVEDEAEGASEGRPLSPPRVQLSWMPSWRHTIQRQWKHRLPN
jgi:hypothetical protein